MGKSSKPTIGFWHKLLLYTGLCHGEVDAVRAVEWGGEMAWEGNQTTSGDIQINKPELFGGEKKEGGIVGTLSVRMGEPTQMPHPRLVEMVPGPWPAARGLLTLVYDGIVGALTPYVKTCRYLVSRWLKGWDTAVWQPDLCKIGEGMNGAHMAYQVLTHTDWGYGEQPADIIDQANLLAMAETLHDEGFGLCLKWTRSESVSAFLGVICQHVGAQFGVRDDKVVFTLYRGDYDVEDLPLIDESSILEVTEWSETLVDGSVNEVTVVGFDCLTGKEIARTYANLASIQATGRVVSEKLQLPGLWNLDLVGRVAARECHAKSMNPQRIKLIVKANAGPFVRGEVRAISWGRKRVQRMAVRVEEVDEGTAIDTRVGLTLLQDVAGMAQTSYIAEVGSSWVAPDTTPLPLDPEHVYEATYRDLVGFMRPADLALLGDESGFLVAVGARPPGPAYNFALFTRTGSVPFVEVGAGDFTPCGLLTSTIGPAVTTITLNGHRGLSHVTVGEECVIGGTEHCRVTSVNASTGVIGVARGCVDTVPQLEHLAGTIVWFPDTYHGYDPTEYLDGETVNAQLRTRTSRGTLGEGAAITRSVAMSSRQFRPLPPGRVRINGDAWPSAVVGEVAITWTHRDRLLQADQLVDEGAASIGPEPGTTYRVRWYIDNVLQATDTGITGTSASRAFETDGTMRVEIEAERDGLTSWQAARVGFAYASGNNPVVLAGFSVQTYAESTSQDRTIPAATQEGDLLLAWVMHRAALTPPAGWTLVDSQGTTSGTEHYVSLYERTAEAGDASSNTTWTQASSTRIAVQIQAWRRAGGCEVVGVVKDPHAGMSPWPLSVVGADEAGQAGIAVCSQAAATTSGNTTFSTTFGSLLGPSATPQHRMAIAWRLMASDTDEVAGTISSSSTSATTAVTMSVIIG